ncbi:MAG: Na/Pi cotransporter family protein [Clostridia bacterium]|nr:Na/Pi cotransporter family protein [Clostridia bacterium]
MTILLNIIELLGGLGFFLFGMTLLGDGLKRVAGGKMETILGKLTSNTFKGVLLGAFVTAVIQSSSATTIMVVGFVNSGIMQLVNAIGIIMGANIGTTATGWLLVLAGGKGDGWLSSATIFAIVAFIGIILYFFCKKQTLKNLGMILLALSVLMSGMEAMKDAMTSDELTEMFKSFISAVSNPFLAIFVGILVTSIIQSCSASIGILQALAITGIIGYDVAIPMVVGMCIGACMPVLLSAIGANVNGKRAAIVYLYFNLSGAVILLSGFYLIDAFVHFDIMQQTATSMGIAIVNTVFKIAATVLLAPMAKLIEKLAVITIRDNNSEDDEFEENLLDDRFLNYPPLALEQSGKTMDQMTNAAFKNFKKASSLLSDFDQTKYDKIMSRELRVDSFEDSLGSYLVRLNKAALSEKETHTAAKYLSCITNVERISDHAVNLADLAKELNDKNINFSFQAKKELDMCVEAISEILDMTIKAAHDNDVETAKKVEPLEDVIDILIKNAKTQHIQRVQEGNCTLELGFVFNECLINFERVADHCSNIAVSVLELADSHVHAHSYLRDVKLDSHESYHKLFAEYADKFDIVLSEILN